MASATPGYWILTTTSSPDGSVARCTWPIDADASGLSSKRAKARSSGRPSSSLGDVAHEREVHRRRRRLQRGERGAELLGHVVADEATASGRAS